MDYQGASNLEVMKLAKKYNNYIIDNIMNELDDDCNNIIDFGSGDGYYSNQITNLIKKDIFNIEPARNLWHFYKSNPYENLNNFAEETIDFIYSLNVLEHIKEDEEIINQFYKVLKHNGKVFLYLPAFPILWTSMDVAVGHYRRYTTKDIKRLFEENKWQIRYVKYADFLGFFITLLFKSIGNKKGKISKNQIKFYDNIIFPLSRFLDKITKGKVLGKNIIYCIEKK